MIIGILSDTHNAIHNTSRALAVFRERGITQVIHCGDITSPEIVYLFAGWDVTFVYGNMDLNRAGLGNAAQQIGANRPMLSREVEVAGKLIGVTHGADQAMLYRMFISGKYSYVCHGHTHSRRDEVKSAYSVRIINPGSLGGNQPEARSVCVLDVVNDALEFIEFPDLF